MNMFLFFSRVHLEDFIPAGSRNSVFTFPDFKAFLEEGHWCHGSPMETDPTLSSAMVTA